MNIQKETDGSLRVELSAHELARFDLTYERLNYENDRTRQLLKTVLDGAGAMTGFCHHAHRLLIQVFPAPASGCTLYFTPFGQKPKRYRQKLPSVYALWSADGLLAVWHRLKNAAVQIYRLQEKYMVISADSQLCWLQEYGDCLPVGRSTLAYIREHGERLT